MVQRESLNQLAEAYLRFLITRDALGMKPFLSLDFLTRQKVSQQLKLIRKLPAHLQYGIAPEAHLWREYVTAVQDDQTVISPLQFDVSFRNVMNPLQTETMVVTIQKVCLEEGQWRIESLLNDADAALLVKYAVTETAPEPPRNDGLRA